MKNLATIFLLLGATALFPATAADAPARDARGFSLPQRGHEFEFPRDHGSHPDFAIEWWYVTGHLETTDKGNPRRYGYQLTFFRLAQTPPDTAEEHATTAFQNDTLHLAHFALSDPQGKIFHDEERLNRSGWDASAAVGDLLLRNGNWSLERTPEDNFSLRGSIRSDITLDLHLIAEKDPVTFGSKGVSQKSADPTAASYYITYTRLAAEGTLSIGGQNYSVQGSGWMDHEISSSQLAANQTGWDWLSIQLDDGREIMAYVLRRDDGSFDPFSSLAWIAQDGSLSSEKIGTFDWQPGGHWSSPATGARYPIAPTLKTTDPASGTPRTFRIRPIMQTQEINGQVSGMAYWEGACDVLDENGKVVGRAYLELAGYSGDLRKRLRGF